MINISEISTLKQVVTICSGLTYDVCGIIYNKKRQIIGFKIKTKFGICEILENQFNLFKSC